MIEANAQTAGLRLSDYIRQLGISGARPITAPAQRTAAAPLDRPNPLMPERNARILAARERLRERTAE